MATDREKVGTLVRHWIEHNDGHRQSYLEWRDKLTDEDLPVTLAALAEVADLTDRANEALKRAAQELGAAVDSSHTHDHSHDAHHPHSH